MKERLDALLVKRGLASSGQRARADIWEGRVYVNGQKEDKPGSKFADDVRIEVKGHAIPYVSRGGVKLEKALKCFDIDLNGLICADAGASTGGFTDCMLKSGAKKVYAIDVGKGQLSWTLRLDERVVCMEKTNIRHVTPQMIGEPVDFATADLSFISLTLALMPIRDILKEGAQAVVLIKPQFEAGREEVGSKGVVRDGAVHARVIEKIIDFAENIGFYPSDLTYSPIKGPEGNIEYLLRLKKPVGGENKKVEAAGEIREAAGREIPGKSRIDVSGVVSTAFSKLH